MSQHHAPRRKYSPKTYLLDHLVQLEILKITIAFDNDRNNGVSGQNNSRGGRGGWALEFLALKRKKKRITSRKQSRPIHVPGDDDDDAQCRRCRRCRRLVSYDILFSLQQAIFPRGVGNPSTRMSFFFFLFFPFLISTY